MDDTIIPAAGTKLKVVTVTKYFDDKKGHWVAKYVKNYGSWSAVEEIFCPAEQEADTQVSVYEAKKIEDEKQIEK